MGWSYPNRKPSWDVIYEFPMKQKEFGSESRRLNLDSRCQNLNFQHMPEVPTVSSLAVYVGTSNMGGTVETYVSTSNIRWNL